MSVSENGGYQPSVSKVDVVSQQRALGASGHFTPNKIIVGMPPYPELEKNVKTALAATDPDKTQLEVADIRRGIEVPSDTYGQLFNGQSFTLTNDGSTSTVYGNVLYPYDNSQPYGAANNITKPSGTNHQWLSVDFVTHNLQSAGSTFGAHIGIILYRWRQLYAPGGLIGNVYPFVGAGAIFGNPVGNPARCGGTSAPNVGWDAPQFNTVVELFGRRVYLAAGDPYALVTPPFTPNSDPYGSLNGVEIAPSTSPPQVGGNLWSPSCSRAGVQDETQYRMITHASDGGWSSYFLYKKVGSVWQLLASSSTGAGSNGSTGTSKQIAPTGYTTPASTMVYGPWGSQLLAFRSSPTSAYGTFNANMGGFAIAAVHGPVSYSVDFSNVQFGACLEGSNCYY